MAKFIHVQGAVSVNTSERINISTTRARTGCISFHFCCVACAGFAFVREFQKSSIPTFIFYRSMASFASSRVGPSCFETNKLFRTSSIDFGRRRQMAMGGTAKFKGTQMREKKLAELIEEKVKEAKQVCEGDDHISDECKVAWDEVEEISQAKADLRLKLERDQDPLQSFCEDNPETDECRIYED